MHDRADFGLLPVGYRLPAATRLGGVRLQVSDLDQSLSYYQDVLGLHLLKRHADHAVLAAHGSREPLVDLRERRGARPVPRQGRLGLFHFAILLPQREALGRFISHLVALRLPFGSADHLVSEALYLSDPDGLGIEVYADRPPSTWLTNGRELRMATDPLDLRDLISASGGAAWAGMPDGTTMGHVHLSVGDLAQARDFYHQGLGLDVTVWSYPGALFMSAGGYHHHLGINTWSAGALAATEADARLIEWEFVLPSPRDVHEAAANVRAAGLSPAPESENVTDTGVVLRDPWGTALRLRAAISSS